MKLSQDVSCSRQWSDFKLGGLVSVARVTIYSDKVPDEKLGDWHFYLCAFLLWFRFSLDLYL